MSESSKSARPRQVTMAGGLAIGGSAFLLLSVFETLGSLGSVETRETVTETLAAGGAEGLGLDVEQALTAMRFGLSIAAVCAAVTLVCGGFVLVKHSGARIALSVATVPIFFTSLFTGTVLAVLVLAAALLLWSGPARDWFAGRPVREVPARGSRRTEHDEHRDPPPSGPRIDAPPTSAPGTPPASSSMPKVSTGTTSTLPRPTQGYGDPTPQGHPEPSEQDPQQSPPAYQPHPDPTAPGGPWSSTPGPDARAPGTVRTAAIVTWVGCGLVLVVGLPLLMVQFYAQIDTLGAEVSRRMGVPEAELSSSMLEASMWVLVVGLAVWSVAAIVLAWLMLRRHDWARYLLLVSAGVSALVALAAFPVGLVQVALAVVAFVLLLRPESKQWFASRRPPPYPQQPPPPGRPGAW